MVALLIALLTVGSPAPSANAPGVLAHRFHVGYANMAVEGNQVLCRVRFFADDLEEALKQYGHDNGFSLEATKETEALFLRYLSDRFQLEADANRLTASILQSGEESQGSELMWWYVLQFEAPADIAEVKLRNTMLFEAFEDQKNIVRVQHFPSEQRQTLYFTAGAEEYAFAL